MSVQVTINFYKRRIRILGGTQKLPPYANSVITNAREIFLKRNENNSTKHQGKKTARLFNLTQLSC